ncbi:hypothetical protein HU200_058976 [Digitaria exilis]|uniref:DUF6598 domain-containing protein n=1 Tax=Digitaria exilis TaxID=1010633 RepID=A0A835AB70_9POAL|nr:hypothetical protein HU200_058976 [Digitaria exilis]
MAILSPCPFRRLARIALVYGRRPMIARVRTWFGLYRIDAGGGPPGPTSPLRIAVQGFKQISAREVCSVLWWAPSSFVVACPKPHFPIACPSPRQAVAAHAPSAAPTIFAVPPLHMLRVGRVCSDLLRPRFLRRPPALARRDAPLIMAPASSPHHDPTRHLDHRSRVNRPSPSVNPKPRRACSLIPVASATTKCCEGTTQDSNSTEEANKGPTEKNNDPTWEDHVYFPSVHDNSTHRDGAIYRNKRLQQQEYWFPDLADRTETQLEPMRYSDDTPVQLPEGKAKYCYVMGNHDGTPIEVPESKGGDYYVFTNRPVDMIQFFSVMLYKSPVSDDGPGSPIGMTGPKRGIEADYMVLIEFDMRIKNGAREEDDQQLIDGAISSYHRSAWKPIRHRIVGDCGGAVDMSPP